KDQVGWQKIERRDDGHKIYQPGDVYLDLSAIAKGYAVDLLGEHLTELGVESWIVDIGGDLRTHGKKADGNPWYIGVERPDSGKERSVNSLLALTEMGVATS